MRRVVPGAVAVLGGTFDPVHVGHIGVATEVLRSLELDRALLVPASTPPHKRHARVTPAIHRLAMLRLAAADRPELIVDSIEIDRGGTSFTIETLCALRDRPDVAAPLFVLGLDSLPSLPSWRAFGRLVREFDLLVVGRPESDLDAILAEAHPDIVGRWVRWPDGLGDTRPALGSGGRVVYVPTSEWAAASKTVRERIAAGEDPGALVPPAVARYIREHGLYVEAPGPDSRLALVNEGGETLTPEIAACVAAARDKKAEDLVVLDLRKSDFTDYLVICHGNSDRQIVAIADAIEEQVRKTCGAKPSHVEGRRQSNWILMDYIDFVVHVFDADKRTFYRLERLWGDAPRVDLPPEGPATEAPGAAAT